MKKGLWDYRRDETVRPLFFKVSAWEWVYGTNSTRACKYQARGLVGMVAAVGRGGHVLPKGTPGFEITAILLPQRLSWYWRKIVSLRMLTNLRLTDLRVTTAQQRSTGWNLPSVLYFLVWSLVCVSPYFCQEDYQITLLYMSWHLP
jgi:hypothetical protein